MSLTVQDLEKMQQQYPDYRMELVKGNISVMSPSVPHVASRCSTSALWKEVQNVPKPDDGALALETIFVDYSLCSYLSSKR